MSALRESIAVPQFQNHPPVVQAQVAFAYQALLVAQMLRLPSIGVVEALMKTAADILASEVAEQGVDQVAAIDAAVAAFRASCTAAIALCRQEGRTQ